MDRKPCFGDRVINTFAGAANPHREGIFVRSIHRLGKLNPGEWYQCTNGKGDFWEIDPRSLEIVSRASADEDRIRRDAFLDGVERVATLVPGRHYKEHKGRLLGDVPMEAVLDCLRALAGPKEAEDA